VLDGIWNVFLVTPTTRYVGRDENGSPKIHLRAHVVLQNEHRGGPGCRIGA
jgi:hypothetical protein